MYGSLETKWWYEPGRGPHCKWVKASLRGNGWREMFRHVDCETAESRALGMAVHETGESDAVAALIDYLIEYDGRFAEVWDEAVEWAAGVGQGHEVMDGRMRVADSIRRAGGMELTVGRITMPDPRCPCCGGEEPDYYRWNGAIRHDGGLIWVCRKCWDEHTPEGAR